MTTNQTSSLSSLVTLTKFEISKTMKVLIILYCCVHLLLTYIWWQFRQLTFSFQKLWVVQHMYFLAFLNRCWLVYKIETFLSYFIDVSMDCKSRQDQCYLENYSCITVCVAELFTPAGTVQISTFNFTFFSP